MTKTRTLCAALSAGAFTVAAVSAQADTIYIRRGPAILSPCEFVNETLPGQDGGCSTVNATATNIATKPLPVIFRSDEIHTGPTAVGSYGTCKIFADMLHADMLPPDRWEWAFAYALNKNGNTKFEPDEVRRFYHPIIEFECLMQAD